MIIVILIGFIVYLLSVGGFIIVLYFKMIVIIFVVLYSLNVRFIVICDDWEIILDVESCSYNFLVVIDGSSEICKEIICFIICRVDYSIKVVKCFNYIFFDILCIKMMWGVDSRV